MSTEIREWCHEVFLMAVSILAVTFMSWIDLDPVWKLAEEYSQGSNKEFYALVIGGYALVWGLSTLFLVVTMLAIWKIALHIWKSCFRS
jgi:hypothetical protein